MTKNESAILKGLIPSRKSPVFKTPSIKPAKIKVETFFFWKKRGKLKGKVNRKRESGRESMGKKYTKKAIIEQVIAIIGI